MAIKQIQEFQPKDMFISLSIYKFPLGNCGGITDYEKDIYVPCKTGYIPFEKLADKLHLVFIEEQRGAEYWCVKPLMQPENMIGPMAGGNLAYCSDSRCKRVYHIHDRFETQQTYDALSR